LLIVWVIWRCRRLARLRAALRQHVPDRDDQGGAQQLTDLLAAVTGVGPGTSLTDKVTLVQSQLAANDLADACSTLTSFIHEVNAQSDRTIPHGEAATLIARAQQIRTVLSC
jgi:hypothetical protein